MDERHTPSFGTHPASGRADLRICHVIDSLRFGGAEKQFINTLNALPFSRKYAVLTREFAADSPLGDALDPSIITLALRARLRYAPFFMLKLARWLKRERVDVVHTHMFWPSLYGVIAARLAGVPVIMTTDHGTDPWKRPIHHWLERRVISRLVQRRFCVSENVRQTLLGTSGVAADKLERACNGTHVPEAVALRETRRFHIGTLGRLVWEKDYGTLIRAAALLRDRGWDFRLSIVGDGPQRRELADTIAQLGLQERVELAGFHTDIDRWLRRFDVFVISSVEEGQPLALLEAMARGLPVVATRVGGIPDTLADGREGVIVEPGSPDRLADGVEGLFADVNLRRRFGRAARERVIREFSVEALAERYAAAYDSAYADARGLDRHGAEPGFMRSH